MKFSYMKYLLLPIERSSCGCSEIGQPVELLELFLLHAAFAFTCCTLQWCGESPPVMRFVILGDFDCIRLCLLNIEYICRWFLYTYVFV